MSIYFKYGNYAHDAGECQVTIARSANKGQDGLTIIGYTTRYTVAGVIQGTSTSDITAKLRALEAAYAYNSKDFGLYDSATGQTAHWVRASASDVRVVEGPTYPKGDGAEYVTGRTYQIVIEAQTGVTVPGLYDFSETVTISGGGQRVVWLETLNGPPQKQITALQTLCTVVQQGKASSATTWPPPASQLFPGSLMEMPTITYSSPQTLDTGRKINYQTSWNYQFGLPTRVNPRPHANQG